MLHLEAHLTNRSSRLVVLLATMAAVVGLFGQIAHWVLVSHELCATHGQIVHGEVAHASSDHDGHAHAGDDDRHADAGVTTDEVDDHDHCATFAEPADTADVSAPLADATFIQRPHAAEAPRSLCWATSLLRLAPKTSPPLA